MWYEEKDLKFEILIGHWKIHTSYFHLVQRFHQLI